MLGLYYRRDVPYPMRKTTMAALAAVAAAAAAGGALATDSYAEHEACPAWSEQDEAEADLIFDQIDEVMAGYGFVYQEPELSEVQEAALEQAVSELEARLEERMPEAGYWGAPTPEQAAEMAALYAEAEAEYESLLAEYGFVIEIPDLSEQDAESMDAELEPLYDRLDALEGGCEAHSAADDLVHDQIDEVMARYGFVYEEPDLSEEREAALDSELDELWSETERAALSGYDGYSVPTPEQAAELARLYAEAGAAEERILRGYGFVIETPDLSEQDAERLRAELEQLYEQLHDSERPH